MARLSVMIPVQGQMREKKSSDHKKNWKENEDLRLLKKNINWPKMIVQNSVTERSFSYFATNKHSHYSVHILRCYETETGI